MRKAVVVAALLAAVALPARGQAVVLQAAQFSNGFSGLTKSLALGFPKLTAGSTLIVEVESQCTAAPKVADSNNRVYTMDVNEAGISGGVSLWHVANAGTAATTITVTLTGCNYSAMQAEEVAGLTGAVTSKAVNTVAGVNSTTFTIGTLATTVGDFIAVGGHNNYGVGGFIGETGFAFLPASQSPAAAEWKTATATSTVVSFGMKAPQYKLTGAAVAYSAGGTPPPPPPPPPPPSCVGTATVTVTGATPPLGITNNPVTLPGAAVGTAYSVNLGTAAGVTGGVPPYSYSANTALPPGLLISSAGVISGIPTTAGTTTFTYTVTDSSGTARVVTLEMVASK